MSRSQKPRTPQHFPRMRHRARKRIEKKYLHFRPRWIVVGHSWEVTDDPFDLTSWTNIEGLGSES